MTRMLQYYGIGFVLIIVIGIYFWSKRGSQEPFPHRLFQTWKNKEPPANMAYWQQTWRKNHPGWHFDFWDDDENRQFIAANYSWFLPTYDGYDREIKRADAVRYFYLYHYGGVYADMDFESLKNIELLLEQHASADILFGTIQSDGRNSSHTIPNAIMISKPKCDFWLKVFQALQEAAKQNVSVEEMTGPVLLKKVYDKYWFGQTHIIVLEPEVLYPISWITHQDKRQQALKETSFTQLTQQMQKEFPNSYAVTYWTHSW